MAKLTLTDITAGYNAATKQNANNALVETAIENTLSRDGTSPNSMSAQLDMGTNKLINVAEGTNGTDGINKDQLDAVGTALGVGLYLSLDGSDVMAGTLSMADNTLDRPVVKDYGVIHTTPVIATNTITYDLSLSNSFDVSLTANITTTTLSNPPASGTYGEITIRLKQDGTGSRTVAGPASVLWPGGTAPVITPAANSVDRVMLVTVDGGTTWDGNFSQDYS